MTIIQVTSFLGLPFIQAMPVTMYINVVLKYDIYASLTLSVRIMPPGVAFTLPSLLGHAYRHAK